MNRWKSFKTGVAMLVGLSVLGAAPAAFAGDRYDRRDSYSNSYDRNYRDDSYRYNNSYRNTYQNRDAYTYRNDSRYYGNDNRYYGNGYYRDYRSPGKSAAIIGGSAAAGAVVGAIAGGGKGAAIGAAVGGITGLIINQANKDHRRY